MVLLSEKKLLKSIRDILNIIINMAITEIILVAVFIIFKKKYFFFGLTNLLKTCTKC